MVTGDPRLSSEAASAIVEVGNELFFSAASYWEICIKIGIGKLALEGNWGKALDREMSVNRIQWLAIRKEHMRGVIGLPFHHRDPFDRLLVAQAQHEELTIITADSNIPHYDVRVLW